MWGLSFHIQLARGGDSPLCPTISYDTECETVSVTNVPEWYHQGRKPARGSCHEIWLDGVIVLIQPWYIFANGHEIKFSS